MGQNESVSLFQEIEKQPKGSEVALKKLWTIYGKNKEDVLQKEEALKYFSSLYDYIKERDKKDIGQSKEETIQQWFNQYDEGKGVISWEQFQSTVQLLVIPIVISQGSKANDLLDTVGEFFQSLINKKTLEEDWEVMNDTVDRTKEVVNLTMNQITKLVQKADSLVPEAEKDPVKFKVVQKLYNNALLLSGSMLLDAEKMNITSVSIYRLQYQHYRIEAKLAEAERLKTQAITIQSTFSNLPVPALVQICFYLDSPSLQNLSHTSHFIHHACKQIKPCLKFVDDIDYNILIPQITGEISEFMVFLPNEIHIQIFSYFEISDLLTVRCVCQKWKFTVDNMFHAEFEEIHIQNFYRLKTELQQISNHEETTTQASDTIGDILIKGALSVAPQGRGIGAIIALGFLLVGGLMKLEAYAGGPISGGIGRAVEKVEMRSTDSQHRRDTSSAKSCESCSKPFKNSVIETFSSDKHQCRACKAILCDYCCSNKVIIPVNKTSYTVSVCNKCYKLIQPKEEQEETNKTTSEEKIDYCYNS